VRFLTPPVSLTSDLSRPPNVSDVGDITADKSIESAGPLNWIPVSDPYLDNIMDWESPIGHIGEFYGLIFGRATSTLLQQG